MSSFLASTKRTVDAERISLSNAFVASINASSSSKQKVSQETCGSEKAITYFLMGYCLTDKESNSYY